MNIRNIILLLATLLLCFALGWWLGSRQVEEIVREEVRYVERPATTIEYKKPEPIKVVRIDLPRLQYTDTIREEVRIPADTASIIADYIKQRDYELDFSTDTTGTFKVRAVVSHNRLASASATISPLQREVLTTTREVRKFRPFVSGGLAVGDKVGASLGLGGIIKEKHIVSAKYMRIGNGNYYGAEYGYIFGK